MKEAFEKINNLLWHKQMQALSRFNELNDLPFNLRNCYDESDLEEAIAQSFEEAQKIVSEVEAEYGNGWIPCSERLPSEEGSYLTTTEYGAVRVNHFYLMHKAWGYRSYKTIAWMPLPEAYKPEKGGMTYR